MTQDHQSSASRPHPRPVPRTSPKVGLRRAVFATLVSLTGLGALALMVAAFAQDGLDTWDLLLITCFALTLPWTVIGFWNAVIGLILMRRGVPLASLTPPDLQPDAPLASQTAILSCIRNEAVDTVARNLDAMIGGLVRAGHGDRFQVYILSDSDWPECLAAEASAAERLAHSWAGRMAVSYRRRGDNIGYKAGNIRDFVETSGGRFDFALVLDADSLMAPSAILGLVRDMEADPQLGILQALTVGLPSPSAFARAFQFGMRLGMRSYTTGSAWWQQDCGPYWGHNALIRIAPFREHCALPVLPGAPPLGGWVLSHDQVEAVLMRRAGYAVRVRPLEGGSWEENPTTLLEFIRRDLRWCQGNLQYFRLLALPGLHPVSRIQLLLAILMFLSSAAWVLFMALGTLRIGLAEAPGALIDPLPGLALLALVMTMIWAPKLASLVDLLLSATGRRAFGGAQRIIAGFLAEAVVFTLLSPVMAIAHTVFMGGLAFGRALTWLPQRRASHRVEVPEALRRLWPQTAVGLAAALWLASLGSLGLWLSPFFLGALLAVPLAVISAEPWLGQALTHLGLWRIPEETDPPPLIRNLGLPALTLLGRADGAFGDAGVTRAVSGPATETAAD
jgi:membrane glycosyltransferase